MNGMFSSPFAYDLNKPVVICLTRFICFRFDLDKPVIVRFLCDGFHSMISSNIETFPLVVHYCILLMKTGIPMI